MELKVLEPTPVNNPSQKSICIRCHTKFPDSATYFPLLDTRLELLRELGIEPYQCADCIRKGVARSDPPRPVYGNDVSKYIRDMKAGVAIAILTGLLLSTLTAIVTLLVGGYDSWREPLSIASAVFAAVILAEAVLYIAD